jgi:hypothetical protein
MRRRLWLTTVRERILDLAGLAMSNVGGSTCRLVRECASTGVITESVVFPRARSGVCCRPDSVCVGWLVTVVLWCGGLAAGIVRGTRLSVIVAWKRLKNQDTLLD